MAIKASAGNTDSKMGGAYGAFMAFQTGILADATQKKRNKTSINDDGKFILFCKESVGLHLGLTPIYGARSIKATVKMDSDGKQTTTPTTETIEKSVAYRKGGKQFTFVLDSEASIKGMSSSGKVDTKKVKTLVVSFPKGVRTLQVVKWAEKALVSKGVAAVLSPDKQRYQIAKSKLA